ncbi:MAG: alkaline phosphatase family protein [Pikeienuella sp.]
MTTTRKAIFIGIDGIDFSEMSKLFGADGVYDTNEIAALNIVEGYTGGVLGTATQQETSSAPGWGALLAGKWTDETGYVSWDATPLPDGIDSVFERIKAADPDARMASLTTWAALNKQMLITETGGVGGVAPIIDVVRNGTTNTAQQDLIEDAEMTAEAVNQVKSGADFTFVHFDSTDTAGHSYGFGEEYNNAMTNVSNQIGEVLAAVAAREAANPDEDWLVIVSTDHGRKESANASNGVGHGGQTPTEREIFIASNKELIDNGESAPQTSVLPTILDHMGVAYDPDEFGGGYSLLKKTSDAEVKTYFAENFESLAEGLKPFESATETGGDGTDWTEEAPEGWTTETGLGEGAPAEFRGWTFLDKNSWVETATAGVLASAPNDGNLRRAEFRNGEGVVALVDPDEYDDGTNIDPKGFDGTMSSPAFDISDAAPGGLMLSFDSSWMPYADQTGAVVATYFNADGQEVGRKMLLKLDSEKPAAPNEHIELALDNPAGAATMKLSFGMADAGNDWWWAVDNIKVSGPVGETVINEIAGTEGRDKLVGADGADAIRSGAGSYDRMGGGAGADAFIFGAETRNGVRERDVILDYEVGVDTIRLEDGASVAAIKTNGSGAVIFLEGDNDAIYVRGEGVNETNLTIITEDLLIN